MYDDERRDPQEFDRIEFEHLMQDVAALRERFQELSRRELRSRRRAEALDTQARESARAQRELQQRVQRAEAALEKERAKHGTTFAKYRAYQAETIRLKEDLKRLRSSLSLRVGRGVLAPASVVKHRWLRQRAGSPAVSAPATAHELRTTQAPQQSALPAPPPTATSALDQPHSPQPVPHEPKLSELTTDQLQKWFLDAPGGIRLGHLLTRWWFDEGRITGPAHLLEHHADLIPELPRSKAFLPARIRGASRLRDTAESLIPGRSPGAAYVPERRRVLYCVNQTPVHTTNGYAARTRGVAQGLVENGWQVRVLGRLGYPWDTAQQPTPPTRERRCSVLDGVEYVHLPDGDLNTDPRDHYVLAAADAVVREARMFRPGVIHAASNYTVGLAALIAARRLGVPFVYEVRGLWELSEASAHPGWEHTERFGLQVHLETLVAAQADRVVAITEQIRQELMTRGVPPERIAVAPNAVDPRAMLPLPTDRTYARTQQIAQDRPVIGFAGSVVAYEGLDLLLQAAAELTRRGREFQVVIAGTGPVLGPLKQLREDLGLHHVVRFLGRVPSAEIPRLISTFTLMSCPRRSERVTELVSPLKPLESFAAAKAVVLSDVAPHRDLAGPGQTRAVLFPAGNAHALADALDGLLADPDHTRALGRQARLWTLDERTWELTGRRMADAYTTATATAQLLLPDTPARTLAQLRVGIIADEFTTETLRPSVQLIPLDPATWQHQLHEEHPDLVLVESAWEGNNGAWHRKIGHYDHESFADLRRLLHECRTRGIPTVFWNKEDPIHFKRFAPAAARCDHVFTTDAHRIGAYLGLSGHQISTVSSLPFYAQPALHNPLPGNLPPRNTVSYAGTYYGDRYRERSQHLLELLEPARSAGLTIYDRQHDDPQSPYTFPPHLSRYVAGSLPYSQVLDAYKAHLASINVNSVTDSPTMYSRRVVEIAASGGVVLSGPGRALQETLGDIVPVGTTRRRTESLMTMWAQNPDARLAEAWRQMRGVLRSHTVDTALTLLARTAGLTVRAPALPSYALVLDGASADLVASVAHQSVAPAEVVLRGVAAPGSMEALHAEGIRVLTSVAEVVSEWIGMVGAPMARTWAEDMLHGTRFGEWVRVGQRELRPDEDSRPMTRVSRGLPHSEGLVRTSLLVGEDVAATCRDVVGPTLELIVPRGAAHPEPAAPAPLAPTVSCGEEAHRPMSVLVAGHDLKFADPWIQHLRQQGHSVLIDSWQNHTTHHEERSLELLRQAEVVFCEWGLGNVQWYSRHVQPHQRLITRVHLQELDRPYLAATRHENVDAYVFVGELIRSAAVTGHGVPAEKTVVIPNTVDVAALDLPKTHEARHTLGLVGMVPQRKRLDLAVDLLELLILKDPRYRLRVKGRTPTEYPWMQDRPEELSYYSALQQRIDALNARHPGAVFFDGFGSDMAQWYTGVGVAVSVSDFESFHLTLADGAASGAVAAALDWDGADLIYPRSWLSATVQDMADAIHETVADPELHEVRARSAQQFVRTHMDSTKVFAQLDAVLRGDAGAGAAGPSGFNHTG